MAQNPRKFRLSGIFCFTNPARFCGIKFAVILEQRRDRLLDERAALSGELDPLETENRKLNEIRRKIDKELADRGKTIEELAGGEKGWTGEVRPAQ